MIMTRYLLTTQTDKIGKFEHEDANWITIILQEDIGGLDVCKDGEWIPVFPAKGMLAVN